MRSLPVGRPVRSCCAARLGGLVCLTSNRAGRREARSPHDHGFTRRRNRREVPMRLVQFFARALGPRRWGRFSAKAIRGQGAVRQAGPHVHALALGHGRPVGPGVRRSWSPSTRLYVYSKPLTLNQANPAEKGLPALVFWLSGWHQYLHHDVNWGLLSRCLLWP